MAGAKSLAGAHKVAPLGGGQSAARSLAKVYFYCQVVRANCCRLQLMASERESASGHLFAGSLLLPNGRLVAQARAGERVRAPLPADGSATRGDGRPSYSSLIAHSCQREQSRRNSQTSNSRWLTGLGGLASALGGSKWPWLAGGGWLPGWLASALTRSSGRQDKGMGEESARRMRN